MRYEVPRQAQVGLMFALTTPQSAQPGNAWSMGVPVPGQRQVSNDSLIGRGAPLICLTRRPKQPPHRAGSKSLIWTAIGASITTAGAAGEEKCLVDTRGNASCFSLFPWELSHLPTFGRHVPAVGILAPPAAMTTPRPLR